MDRFYDRSRVVADWKCPRARYWGYEYGGRGVTSPRLSLELFLGSSIHDGLAAFAHGVDVDEVAKAAHEQVYKTLMEHSSADEYESVDFANEQAALVEGLLRGFYRYVWPALMSTYPKIRAVEQEMLYEHGGLKFMSKPDLVVEGPEGLVYIEYKSTSSKRAEWVNAWGTAVQLHSTIRAIERTLGEKVSHVIVQGLYKGYESYGKQSSPFCYAYARGGTPPFTVGDVRYDYAPGYRRTATWQLEGGVARWVAEMPDHILAQQFPQSPPILVKDDLVEAFFRQRTSREEQIRLCMISSPTQADLDDCFPQKFDQCTPSFGHPCGFRQLCHGGVDDPFAIGFTWREAHHAPEKEQHDRGGESD